MRKLLVIVVFVAVLATAWILGHVYLVERLLDDPGVDGAARSVAVAVIALLALSIALQPLAERYLPPRQGRLVAWPAFLWMGLAFYLIVFLGLSDVLLLLRGAPAAAGIAAAVPADPVAAPRAVLVVLAALVAGGVALAGGLRRPRDARQEIRLARWPRALDGFRIAQISDVHIGPLLDRRFAAQITRRVNALEPDLIVVTGDLVDGPVEHLADEVAPFAELRARHGVYFVTGNHDYYSGADPWLAQVRALGMRPLRNERVTIERDGASFDLAGVDDHRASLFGPGHGEDVPRALAGRDPARAVILLAHDPTTFKAAAPLGVDLQISGHTHGGQLWPFGYLVRLAVTFVAGHYRRGDAQLFVSRGTGFWGPPMRLGAPAEIAELVIRA
jgi:hypothetical protein